MSLINDYGTTPRAIAGEAAQPYPDISTTSAGPEIAGVTVTELVEIADRLWPLFAAPTPAAKAQTLNQLLDRCHLAPAVDVDSRVRWTTPPSSRADTVSAGCVATLIDAVAAGGLHRLSTCDGEDCVDVHLDISGRNRRYCSTTCLNRARIRAYRARQRS